MTDLNKIENELNVNDNINQAEQSVWVDTIAGNLALSDEVAPAAEALVKKLESVSISEEETLETFFQKFTLSEQEVETLQKSYANDNFPALPSDPNQMAAGWLKIKRQVQAEAIRLKSLPLSEGAYLKKLQGVQTSAAQQLLMECMIGEDLRSIPTQYGLKEGSKRREKDGKKTKKRIEKERYPHLTACQIRDFKHLFLNNVIEAIKYAYEQGQIPT